MRKLVKDLQYTCTLFIFQCFSVTPVVCCTAVEVSYQAKVDESSDLVVELETSVSHDPFHPLSALQAQWQN